MTRFKPARTPEAKASRRPSSSWDHALEAIPEHDRWWSRHRFAQSFEELVQRPGFPDTWEAYHVRCCAGGCTNEAVVYNSFSCYSNRARTKGSRRRRRLCETHGRVVAQRHELAWPEIPVPPLRWWCAFAEYIDEGWCGPFDTREQAEANAVEILEADPILAAHVRGALRPQSRPPDLVFRHMIGPAEEAEPGHEDELAQGVKGAELVCCCCAEPFGDFLASPIRVSGIEVLPGDWPGEVEIGAACARCSYVQSTLSEPITVGELVERRAGLELREGWCEAHGYAPCACGEGEGPDDA